jgi:hypothetical protein
MALLKPVIYACIKAAYTCVPVFCCLIFFWPTVSGRTMGAVADRAPGQDEFRGPIKMRYYELKKPAGGFNGIAVVALNPQEDPGISHRREFSLGIDRKTVHYNDLGLDPDIKKDDGLFSAYVKFDFQSLADGQERFAHRLETSLNEAASARRPLDLFEFSGRSVATQKPFIPPEFSREPDAFDKQMKKRLAADRIAMTPAALDILPALGRPEKTLLITDTSVVADPYYTFDQCDTDHTRNNTNPNAPWSLKTLLANINNSGISDRIFIHHWLRSWMLSQGSNDQTISFAGLFTAWDGINPASLDIDRLPFRLLAIVNRLDLAKIGFADSNGGEIGFVFGLVNPNNCRDFSDQKTLILEYGDAAETCEQIQTRAQHWLQLNELGLGTPDYLSALAQVTDSVTAEGRAHNTLKQLRTNYFDQGTGHFLEFNIDSVTGFLKRVPTEKVDACSGCHEQETQTSYSHINPITRELSGFMTGIAAPDPPHGRIRSDFNELARRGQIMEDLAGKQCFSGEILRSLFARTGMRLRVAH